MPSSSRTVDSLYEELVVYGLLKKSVAVALRDYVGEPPTPAPGGLLLWASLPKASPPALLSLG